MLYCVNVTPTAWMQTASVAATASSSFNRDTGAGAATALGTLETGALGNGGYTDVTGSTGCTAASASVDSTVMVLGAGALLAAVSFF